SKYVARFTNNFVASDVLVKKFSIVTFLQHRVNSSTSLRTKLTESSDVSQNVMPNLSGLRGIYCEIVAHQQSDSYQACNYFVCSQ
ncbi:hypothetical protein V1478_004430, partial [Vespula squamosa]